MSNARHASSLIPGLFILPISLASLRLAMDVPEEGATAGTAAGTAVGTNSADGDSGTTDIGFGPVGSPVWLRFMKHSQAWCCVARVALLCRFFYSTSAEFWHVWQNVVPLHSCPLARLPSDPSCSNLVPLPSRHCPLELASGANL